VRDLEIKEMPIAEKYDRLFDFFVLDHAVSYASHKKLGTLDKYLDDTVEAFRKMMPRFMAPVVKLMMQGHIKEAVNQMVYLEQHLHQPARPHWVSDREVVLTFKNCERLRRRREIVKEAGLNIDPRELCEMEKRIHFHTRHPMRQMGLDVTAELGETGCKWTFKLK